MFFYVTFYSGHVFYVFYFLKRSWKIPSETTFETTETNWVCMIVFLCAHVWISISTYILTSIVIYLPYRLTSSDATRRCVFVYVGKLVGWKTSTLFIQRLQMFFFYFCHVLLRFLTFIFFLERFLHLWCDPSAAQMGRWTDSGFESDGNARERRSSSFL